MIIAAWRPVGGARRGEDCMRTMLLVTALCALTAGAATREELMQADRNFRKTVAERGVDGWVDSFAENGKMFPIGRDVAEGKKRFAN